MSFHKASVLRLRDDPQFSLFSNDWSCDPPDVCDSDSPEETAVKQRFRELHGIDAEGNLLPRPSRHYRLLYPLAVLVQAPSMLQGYKDGNWAYTFGRDHTREYLDTHCGGAARRVELSWNSGIRDCTWEQCYFSVFLNDRALAGVLPGSEAHFEYMFRKGGPPKKLADTFGPRIAQSVDIMAHARAEWQAFRDGTGPVSNGD